MVSSSVPPGLLVMPQSLLAGALASHLCCSVLLPHSGSGHRAELSEGLTNSSRGCCHPRADILLDASDLGSTAAKSPITTKGGPHLPCCKHKAFVGVTVGWGDIGGWTAMGP